MPLTTASWPIGKTLQRRRRVSALRDDRYTRRVPVIGLREQSVVTIVVSSQSLQSDICRCGLCNAVAGDERSRMSSDEPLGVSHLTA